MQLSQRWLLLLCVLLPPCAAGARATTPVWALLAEARVTSASIYLSDLLPEQTSQEMRATARKIFLAAAPPPGGTLTLEGARIAPFLPEAARNEVTIPPQVVVHRTGRLLTQDEVVTAIRAALRNNGLPGSAGIAAENVHFPASVTVSVADARLEVRRVDFDPTLRQARFLLVSAADRRALPFLATAELPSETRESIPAVREDGTSVVAASARWVSGRGLIRTRDGEPSVVRAAAAPNGGLPLIEAGRNASLHVSSGTMQMFLDVIPLERGALHETVRVKLPGNGKVLRGEVIAPDRLEAQF